MTTTDVRVLAAYLAPLLAGARVLYVGDLDDAEPLFEAGARLVHVYRFTKPEAPLEGAVLVQSFQRGLDLPSGGFDLAIVEDLGKVGARLDLLAALRGGLGARGVAALVAHTGQGQIDYTELYDACSTLFEHVKMVGKLPFTGTLLCELGLETEPDVSVDTELAELDAPDTLLAIVSQRTFALDEYAIFAHPQAALPAPPVLVPLAPPAPPAPAVDLIQLAEISQLTLQNQALAAQLQEEREVRTHAAALSRELEAAVAASATAREEALQLRNALAGALAEQSAAMAATEEQVGSDSEMEATLAALAEQSERAEHSEARAQSSAEQLTAAEARVRTLEAAVQSVETRLRSEVGAANERSIRAEYRQSELEDSERELRQKLDRVTAEAARTTAALTKTTAETARLTAALAEAEARAAEPAPPPVQLATAPVDAIAPAEPGETGEPAELDDSDELVQLETVLRERGRVILALEAELARRERMVTQLLLAERLAAPKASRAPSGVQLEHKLDELAREVARREGELEARGWRIQELESALAAAAKTPDSFR